VCSSDLPRGKLFLAVSYQWPVASGQAEMTLVKKWVMHGCNGQLTTHNWELGTGNWQLRHAD
jgi:hypothetical protein